MSEDASSQLGSPKVPNGVHKANGPASGRKAEDDDSVSQASTSSAESLVSVAAERFPSVDELTVLVRALLSLCRRPMSPTTSISLACFGRAVLLKHPIMHPQLPLP